MIYAVVWVQKTLQTVVDGERVGGHLTIVAQTKVFIGGWPHELFDAECIYNSSSHSPLIPSKPNKLNTTQQF